MTNSLVLFVAMKCLCSIQWTFRVGRLFCQFVIPAGYAILHAGKSTAVNPVIRKEAMSKFVDSPYVHLWGPMLFVVVWIIAMVVSIKQVASPSDWHQPVTTSVVAGNASSSIQK